MSTRNSKVKEEKKSNAFFRDEVNSVVTTKRVDWKTITPPQCVTVTNIAKTLRANFEAKQQLKTEEEETQSINPKILLESESIATVRKENLFSSEVTESEQDIIDKRVALQRRHYAEFEKREYERKAKKIRDIFEFLIDDEIKAALSDCENDEEEVIVRMTQHGYLHQLRKKLSEKQGKMSSKQMSEEQKEAYEQLLKKRKETLRKTSGLSSKNQYHRMKGRLTLDEALKQVQDNNKDLEKAFEGWSEARIKAYKAIETKPNTYYYRFNAPGEEQKKGPWTDEEEKLFFQRLEEVGADGQWGLFSMAIPGRVGYQCSNFYRLLIETGRITDPNYVLDPKGKAHYLFSTKNKQTGVTEKTFRTHVKHGSRNARASGGLSSSSSGSRSVLVRRKRRRTRLTSDDDEDEDFDCDDSGSYTLKSWNTSKRTKTRASSSKEESGEEIDPFMQQRNENPLPGFTDPITLDEVVKPAMSPYGHVMSYDSWVRCLSSEPTKNICPLTKRPLTKRELIILTVDNIDQYRSASHVCKALLNSVELQAYIAPNSFHITSQDLPRFCAGT
ncbi:6832_t:CDS:10 [Paraglomus occultum]|uniref:6832_t:CDS:1 n=1 Tax=Paraglomus occultum TaxID=144539 RepID=A0A9N8WCU7_9GLOM|nr:6832_t:CDS:10 [Paraglomus occultum]